jgi:hypothetical protein
MFHFLIIIIITTNTTTTDDNYYQITKKYTITYQAFLKLLKKERTEKNVCNVLNHNKKYHCSMS